MIINDYLKHGYGTKLDLNRNDGGVYSWEHCGYTYSKQLKHPRPLIYETFTKI